MQAWSCSPKTSITIIRISTTAQRYLIPINPLLPPDIFRDLEKPRLHEIDVLSVSVACILASGEMPNKVARAMFLDGCDPGALDENTFV